MTEQERIDRAALLRRAVAVAGAVYAAPALTSSARAEADACAGHRCEPGRTGRRKCRKAGGKHCGCFGPRDNWFCQRVAHVCETPCVHGGDTCGSLEPCGGCGD